MPGGVGEGFERGALDRDARGFEIFPGREVDDAALDGAGRRDLRVREGVGEGEQRGGEAGE